jgi:SH3-like domain-containing protein
VADALAREAAHASQAQNVRYVRARRLNLRAGPSKEETVLGQLPQGMPVFAERSEGDWALVRTPEGEVGWVFAALLAGR